MNRRFARQIPIRFSLALVFVCAAAASGAAQERSLQIDLHLHAPFQFVAYGDSRFTDPSNIKDTNPEVRQDLVRAIADIHPAFIAFGGDIPMDGSIASDWQVYDRETSIWRENRVPVFPALGNHELRGDQNIALANYFARFPALRQHRFYSVRAANILLLTLDSSQDETSGPQGEWLQDQFKHLSGHIDFVFISLHHPLVTSAGDKTNGRGGSAARPAEVKLAEYLEAQQKSTRARIIVFASHVHNYERHERNGVTYFVTGGGGAHAYPISRSVDDPFQSTEINYHYILIQVRKGRLTAIMNRVEVKDGVDKWTQPDSIVISAPRKHKSPIL
jgi:hypothetical protein